MKECPKCHGKYDDKIRKCPACNIPLHDSTSRARYCAKCGNEIPEGCEVCPHCMDKSDKGKSIITGIALKDGDEIDRNYQKQFQTCPICGRRLKDKWEKEHNNCFYCSHSEPASPTNSENSPENSVFKPTSSAWLRRASGRYEIITLSIYAVGALLAFLYMKYTGFDFTEANICVCLGIIIISVFTALGYSAIGAHLRGMADIIDALEHIISKNR